MVMYKAVRITNDGRLISAFELPTKMLVEYKVGEWVYPNKEVTDICQDYGIFVSRSPEVLNTITACTLETTGLLKGVYGGTYAVYECEVEYPEQEYSPYTYYFFPDYDDIPELSVEKSFYTHHYTVVVRACKLTRQLTYSELLPFYNTV